VQLNIDTAANELLSNPPHEFALGPLRDHPSFEGKARQYYCARCEWTLLMSGSKVVLLGPNSKLLAVGEDLPRYVAPEIRLCPVFEAVASEMLGARNHTNATALRNGRIESRDPAVNHVSKRSSALAPLVQAFVHLRRSLERLVGTP
jgi:hypothetical protein